MRVLPAVALVALSSCGKGADRKGKGGAGASGAGAAIDDHPVAGGSNHGRRTATGANSHAGRPTLPQKLAPAHHTEPSRRVAHEISRPITTRSHSLASPTWVGTGWDSVKPWANHSLAPQHHNVPSARTAQP